MAVNFAPPTADEITVRSIAFPFHLGESGFPQLAEASRVAYYHILALMLTGTSERVMHVDLGVNTHRMVFGTMSPLLQARVANEVTRALQLWVPEVRVESVVPRRGTLADGSTEAMIVDVAYQLAGQPGNMQVAVPLVGPGLAV